MTSVVFSYLQRDWTWFCDIEDIVNLTLEMLYVTRVIDETVSTSDAFCIGHLGADSREGLLLG